MAKEREARKQAFNRQEIRAVLDSIDRIRGDLGGFVAALDKSDPPFDGGLVIDGADQARVGMAALIKWISRLKEAYELTQLPTVGDARNGRDSHAVDDPQGGAKKPGKKRS